MCLVQDIRQVTVSEDKFFVLANKRNRTLGKFLVSIQADNMDDLVVDVLVSQQTKLDIADA